MYRRLIPAVCLFVLCMGLASQASAPMTIPNVALEGTATSSSNGWGWVPELAIDGNLGTGSHSATISPDEWWEVELDQDYDLAEIVVYNRANCCWDRITGVVVKALDADRNEIYVSDPIAADVALQGSVHSFDNDGAGFPGARYIRVEAGISYVQLMEVQALPVWPFAVDANPADGATDVPRDDTVLSWTPGAFADKHDVYLGTSLDDVNDADTASSVYMGNQDPNTYATARLDFGQTYYWRVDEVDADLTIHKGDVVQVTVEPVAYSIENVTVTASGNNSEDEGPENTINSAGLDANDLHSIEPAGMWLSSTVDEGNVAWIQYEFDRVYKLHQMQVWNHNTLVEAVLGFGVKEATIEYSVDGNDYTTLGTTEFARAPGAAGYAHNTTVDFGVAAKYVKITTNSNWGGIVKQYGLSEVRFSYVPVWAKELGPASGTTGMDVDNVTLSWRAGREAGLHDVYISTDELEVIDETISPVNVPGGTAYASYDTGELELGATYYWKVNEVNEAETPTTWQGEVSSFSTEEYLVVETFEDYDDISPDRIFETWIDGLGYSGQHGNSTGSIVGYIRPPYAEQSIVHGDEQSMPLFYDNSGAAGYSETTANVGDSDWTVHGIKSLSLWFCGDASNSAEQMYVKLNGSKVLYDGEAANLALAAWQPWNIELADFGVDLSNVTELGIGFERSGETGGSGIVCFDDIRLYAYSRQLITPVEPDTAGLVGHWTLDGNPNDLSGNGYDGVAEGGVTYGEGVLGLAAEFNGSDALINCGDVPVSDTGAISIAFWVKPRNIAQDWAGYVSKWTLDNAQRTFWLGQHATNGWLRFGIYPGGPTAETAVDSGQVILANEEWTHIVCTYDGDIQKIYADGVEVVSSPERNAALVDRVGNLRFGIVATANWFNGLIDEVRIYDRALSEGEVAWFGGRTEPFDKPF